MRLLTVEKALQNYALWDKGVLREAGKNINFVAMAMSPSEQQRAKAKWEKYDTTTENQKKIIWAAKKGDRDAINYTFIKLAPNIGKTFWTSYLGPSGAARQRRIDQGAAAEWTSLAYESLVGGYKGYRDAKGALQTFDPDKYDTGNLFDKLGFYYWNILKNTSNESNYKDSTGGMADTPGIKGGSWTEKRDGITSYDPTYMDSEQESRGDVGDVTADDFFEKEEVKEFISNWKRFAQDPIVTERRAGVSPGGLLRASIEETRKSGSEIDAVSKLATIFTSVSRQSIKTYIDKATALFPEYDLTPQMMFKAIKMLGEDKVASYLPNDRNESQTDTPSEETPVQPPSDVVSPAKAEKQARVAKEAPSGDYVQKWKKLSEDPHLWTSARKGWTAGLFLFEMIKDPKITPETFSEWNNIPGTWNEVTFKRTLKLVAKYGLDWSKISKLPQKERDNLASEIGVEE